MPCPQMQQLYNPADVDHALQQAISHRLQSLGDYVARPGKDFTRNRRIPIDVLIDTIITMGGDSIREEIKQNLSRKERRNLDKKLDKKSKKSEKSKKSKKSEEMPPSTSAFVQQRQKLSYTFFEDLLNDFISITNSYSRTYKGRRILASDGSDIYLPPNPKETDYFIQNGENNQPYCLMHLDGLYEVLTKAYVAASTQGKRKADEKEVAIGLMKKCPIDNALLTGDRGYESFNFLANLQERKWEYLLRAKDVRSNGIASGLKLPDSKEFDVDIELNLTNKLTNEVKKLIAENPNSYKHISGRKFDFLPDTSRKHDPLCMKY